MWHIASFPRRRSNRSLSKQTGHLGGLMSAWRGYIGKLAGGRRSAGTMAVQLYSQIESFEDRNAKGDWRVEHFDDDGGLLESAR
jgi:hypothetical protein